MYEGLQTIDHHPPPVHCASQIFKKVIGPARTAQSPAQDPREF